MTLNGPAFEMTDEPTSQLPMWAEKTRTPLPSATASAQVLSAFDVDELRDVRRAPSERA